MPRYQVIEPILHDGHHYHPGQTIELSIADANELRAHKALGPILQGGGWELPAAAAPFAPPAEPTPLPDDFPGRAALVAAGRVTVESLAGLTAENLTAIRSIGDSTATAILTARDAAGATA